MTPDNIEVAIERLKKGEVILLPTLGGWSFVGDASLPDSVNKINSLKNENSPFPPTILLSEIGLLRMYSPAIPDVAWDIIEWEEKPMTVIFDKGNNVHEDLLNPDGQIALRFVAQNDPIQKLLFKYKKAIVSLLAVDNQFNLIKNIEAIDEYSSKVFPELTLHNKPLMKVIYLSKTGQIKFIKK